MNDSYASFGSYSRPFPVSTIPEDTVHYVLHLTAEEDPTSMAVLITDYVYSLLTQPWLWNKDSWELRKRSEGSGLEGRMRVGDSIDDEWCVVWLLKEISEKWPELVISLRDSDGEFLLIEAANELPAWVNPDNATNRLWLQGGHLHLIPLDIRSLSISKQIRDDDEEEEATLTEEDGVKAARTGKYRAQAIERAVWSRVEGYHGRLRDHLHRTNAYLPIGIAKALSVQPDLIQRAVEAFYVRDPAQLRAASRMTHFPPAQSTLTSVLMTRPAYAQLQGQVFHAPRVFGPEWHVKDGSELDDERRWRDLGVKISTGFEIMYREGGKRIGKASSSRVGYDEFLQNLQRAGFFGNEMQGSQKWKEREAVAQKGWNEAQSEDSRKSFASQVDEAIKAAPESFSSSSMAEDSASWLEISPSELEGMMARSSGAVLNEKPEHAGEDAKALGDLAQKVQEFVGGEGDMQGAMFLDELSDDDDESDEEEAKEDRDQRMRDLVPPLPSEEWGRKTVPKSGKEADKNLLSETDRPPMRPPAFAKQQYDGVESDSGDSDDEMAPAGTLGRLAAELRLKDAAGFEDVEKELAKNKKRGLGENIDEEMRRRVWGEDDNAPQIIELDGDDEEEEEGDVDMNGQEEEFLRFTREALGITHQQWEDILSSRRDRGAFVPTASTKPAGTAHIGQMVDASNQPQTTAARPGSSPLDSFEKVMEAMDAQLAAARGPSKDSKSTLKDPKTFPAEADIDGLSDGELEAMDRELKAALQGAASDDDMDDDGDNADQVAELGEEEKREYRMMKDFLESYRAQAGQSGVIGNLFGRLQGEGRSKE
ncbi:SGT1 protein-domain-containing protein [Kockovaella imperatae]|uniref:SGT1 protein-domain-containing protein n=1 Tax=Kockovaella imperatae TaxID=4999 RepID=A0A1Y1U9I1_9TREE|nr:SGT1 protein-domain-containing protein [Kockovaella imperatae]ORX34672.1 SGT1 protein-domain-containing protein [Kockovaella imperatae]